MIEDLLRQKVERQQNYITFLVKERNKILSIPIIGWMVRKLIIKY